MTHDFEVFEVGTIDHPGLTKVILIYVGEQDGRMTWVFETPDGNKRGFVSSIGLKSLYTSVGLPYDARLTSNPRGVL